MAPRRDPRPAAGDDAARPTPKHESDEQAASPAPAPARPAPPRVRAPVPPPGGRRARALARDEAVRTTLEPLGPGERPTAIVAAATIALLLALANLALMVSGYKIQGQSAAPISGTAFVLVMLAAAGGLWRMRYWAVLGFEALLGIAIVFFSLFLLRASNLEGAALCLFVIGGGGWLFWKLVRVMSRLQMPERP